MRSVARRGFSIASRSVKVGRTLSVVAKRPCTWQARMRTSSITGVLVASDSSKPFFTALTMQGRFGRGSSSQICDFIANGCTRSCMIEEPSP